MNRPPMVAANGMVATSQPLATRAGLRALERGGNAADAALAGAAVLAVTEPTGNSIGGDNFAIVWQDGRAEGLDSAGPAPRNADPLTPVDAGRRRALRHRSGRGRRLGGARRPLRAAGARRVPRRRDRRGRERLRGHAAHRGGLAACSARSNGVPATAERGGDRAPTRAGGNATAIATEGPTAFYEGEVARAIAAVCWLEEEDLARTSLAGSSRCRSRTAATPCSSCRRRRRVLRLWRGLACSSAPRPAWRPRSGACSSRSRTRSPGSATART